MALTRRKRFVYAVQYAAIFIFLKTLRLFPFTWRIKLGSKVFGFIVSNFRSFSNRINQNLDLIHPEMSSSERRQFIKNVGRNSGAAILEILNNDDFLKRTECFEISGPGLKHITDSHKNGTGVILVSGHFGSWQAPRIYLKNLGLEVAGVYRPTNNIYYNPIHKKMLEVGGAPMFARGRKGMTEMVKHLRAGGAVGILLDQKVANGEILQFMGENAKTSTAAAALALKYDIPLIPSYGIRRKNSDIIDVIFEEPIPKSDAITMTQQANDSLEEQVKKAPDQWYWLHRRWQIR